MKKKFDIEGMTCAACQAHVEKATKNLEGVSNVNVNLLSNSMDIEFDENFCKIEDIKKAVYDAGYKAYLKEDTKKEEKVKSHTLRDLIISSVFLILLMYVSMGNGMLNWPLFPFMSMESNKMGFALSQFILLLPIIYIYRKYFINGLRMLFKRNPNMDTLIAIGSLASIIYGVFSLFMISYGYYLISIGDNSGIQIIENYHMNLYFESAGMILVLVSLGKFLEELSKRKTTKELENLIKLKPDTALLFKDNKEVLIDAKDVKIDDILIIKKGAIVPVDGVVVEGNGSINEANITGESIPRYKDIDDLCYSSTILESGYLKIKATKVGDDTSIAKIINLVSEASNSKAPISKLADRISKVFVPIIILISLLTFTVNMILASSLNYDNSFELALNFAITVLVIACPCALGLATPVAIMVGTGKGASLGLLIKNASILENTGKIKTIVFDKTGTITNGTPNVSDFNIDDKYKDIIYSMEVKSSHPLANSICKYLNNSNNLDIEIEEIVGMGIKALYNNETYYISNDKILLKLNIENTYKDIIDKLSKEGKTPLLFIKDSEILGYLALKDEVKENTKDAIKALNDMNIKTIMLTGDNNITASSIAYEIGISSVISDVLPVDKGDIIDKLKMENGGLISMVGDGVNDAIALSKSDIAISVKGASDVAIDTSDIILVSNDLFDIVNVIRLSKRVLFTIKLCLFWAFFYNLICVVLATGFLFYVNGFKMIPMYGSIAMSISSVSVVLTALSINLFKKKNNNIKEIKEMKEEIKVLGMMCEKCEHHVEEACKINSNITSVKANRKKNNVVIEYNDSINLYEIKESIKNAGYEVK